MSGALFQEELSQGFHCLTVNAVIDSVSSYRRIKRSVENKRMRVIVTITVNVICHSRDGIKEIPDEKKTKKKKDF